MAGRRTCGLVVVVLFLCAATAGATTVRPRNVVCPVCDKKIVVLAVTSSNSFGGPDYDLCSHAAGESPRPFGIWTCPHCLWSRFAGEFEKTPEPGLKKRVLEELKSPLSIPADAGQRDIPVWLKFRLSATILDWEKAPPEQMAHHFLAAAWATRCAGQQAMRPVWEDEELKERCTALNDAEWKRTDELETERPGEIFYHCRVALATADRHIEAATAEGVSEVDAMLLRMLAASLFRYRGENARAVEVLKPLDRMEKRPDSVRKATATLLDSILKEAEFQREFIIRFTKSVELGTQEEDDLAAGTYVGGETLRRLGREKEAAEWIGRALTAEKGPGWLTAAATDALKRMGVEGPSKENLAEVRKRRIADAVARLSSPKTANQARHELQVLRAPEALPGIVAALDHEHPEVRSEAALALGHQPEPTDAAIDRLGRLLLEDEEQEPRWRAAVSLERIGAARSRETLEKSLVKENDEQVLRSVIGALGIVGEPESIRTLLKAWHVDDRNVAIALTRIANREVSPEHNTREELLEWWAANLPGKRKDWVRAGFEAAGIELKEPWARESVPQLLALLEDKRYWIRGNAVRILREISGRLLPWEEIAYDADYPAAREKRKAEIQQWREWWEEEKKKTPEKD